MTPKALPPALRSRSAPTLAPQARRLMEEAGAYEGSRSQSMQFLAFVVVDSDTMATAQSPFRRWV
jgi:hypothetical protein